MRANIVIGRFLSLLDVYIILIGFLLITLISTKIDESNKASKNDINNEKMSNEFIFIITGGKENEKGKCFTIDSKGKFRKELKTDTDDDILEIKNNNGKSNDPKRLIFLLFFPDKYWYPEWTPTKIANLEKTWGIKLHQVNNVNLGDIE